MTIQLDSSDIDTVSVPSADEPATGTTTVDEMLDEISALDDRIIDAIRRRTELTRRAGTAAQSDDSGRDVRNHEMNVLERFADLGDDGRAVAMALLRLARTA